MTCKVWLHFICSATLWKDFDSNSEQYLIIKRSLNIIVIIIIIVLIAGSDKYKS